MKKEFCQLTLEINSTEHFDNETCNSVVNGTTYIMYIKHGFYILYLAPKQISVGAMWLLDRNVNLEA